MNCDKARHDCGREGGWRQCRFQEGDFNFPEYPARFCYRHWGEWGEAVITMQSREMVDRMEESSIFVAGIYEERNPPQLEKTVISDATLAGMRDLIKERRRQRAHA